MRRCSLAERFTTDAFATLRDKIASELAKAPTKGVLAKYRWLASEFNEAVEAMPPAGIARNPVLGRGDRRGELQACSPVGEPGGGPAAHSSPSTGSLMMS